ncbi:hypothetical protein PR048_007002 [Dryococelus australis]|uniref:Uncharacterized protein n=1 Tax=Dryococelus australis TaxID=614101 RepID=A0ABQ9ICF5_9NEOP|nr:hypothetical protein PR048_007002 [Dryococelus australis]
MDVEKWAIKGQDCYHNKQKTGKTKGTERKCFKRNEAPCGPRVYQANILFTAFSCEVMSKDNILILDSGATNQLVVGSLEECMLAIRTLPNSVVIKTANGGEMIATRGGKSMGYYGSGTISFEGLKYNHKEKVTIKGENVSVECEKGHYNLFILKLNPVTENTKHTVACQ